jgi:hypothetical protein
MCPNGPELGGVALNHRRVRCRLGCKQASKIDPAEAKPIRRLRR